jgi:large repetitive protein
LAALAAVLGTSLLFCAGASAAKIAQTIAFTSTPPSHAVAGGTYEVSATSSSPVPVGLVTEGACGREVPQGGAEQHLRHGVGGGPPPEVPRPPVLVHFVRAGMCVIKAESWHGPTTAAERAVYEEYAAAPVVEQRVVVAKDPFERIAFTSTPPSHATVGESYDRL